MCSVLGCYSSRVPRFKLPEDPDMRLGWIQFFAKVNEQRFKQSSWRDISVCCEHFERNCFENPSHSPTTLKPNAVLCFHSEEPEPSDRETLAVSQAHGHHMLPSLYFMQWNVKYIVIIMCILQVIICACKMCLCVFCCWFSTLCSCLWKPQVNFSSLVPAIHNRKVKIVIIMVVRQKKIILYSINLQAPVEVHLSQFHLCIKSTCILIWSQRNKSCKTKNNK